MIALVSDLHAYERMLQALFAKGGELATAAILAQASHNISPISGHQVLTGISQAQLMTSTALGHIAQAHRDLERLARALGIDPTGFGDVLKAPAIALGNDQST